MNRQRMLLRSSTLILLALILLGLALRLLVAWQYNIGLPDTEARLKGDEPGYDGLATALLQGVFFQWPGRTPVYPMFLAACYLVLGHSYAQVVYVQAFINTASIPLTFLLARRFTSTRGALIAAAIIAIHPAMLLHVTRLYSEVVYTPLLLVASLALLRALEGTERRRYGWAGALLAIVNLCRPTLVMFPALLPLLLPRRWSIPQRIGICAVYAGAMIAVIAPWTYHNYRTYHTLLPLSVSTALLWQGSPEFNHEVEQGRNLLQIWDGPLNPKRNGGHDPFSIEGDRYFTARAIASIRAEPLIYLRSSLKQAAYLWVGNPVIDWPSHAMFSVAAMQPYFSPLRIAGTFAARLFPVVALVALVVVRRRWRTFLPLILICAYVTLLHALTFAEVRYSEPLHPLLATLVAAASVELAQRYRRPFQHEAVEHDHKEQDPSQEGLPARPISSQEHPDAWSN